MSVIDRWFNSIHLNIRNQICLDDLHGYVLPHASTAYTGHIIYHTLGVSPSLLELIPFVLLSGISNGMVSGFVQENKYEEKK
jgi:hypothetical protein